MPETPKPVPLHVQLNQEKLTKAGESLKSAFSALAASANEEIRRITQVREVGALFEVWRSGEDDRHARFQAALESYDTEQLADLSKFGGYLASAAAREHGRRPD